MAALLSWNWMIAHPKLTLRGDIMYDQRYTYRCNNCREVFDEELRENESYDSRHDDYSFDGFCPHCGSDDYTAGQFAVCIRCEKSYDIEDGEDGYCNDCAATRPRIHPIFTQILSTIRGVHA